MFGYTPCQNRSGSLVGFHLRQVQEAVYCVLMPDCCSTVSAEASKCYCMECMEFMAALWQVTSGHKGNLITVVQTTVQRPCRMGRTDVWQMSFDQQPS
jgi:hypothetical protein